MVRATDHYAGTFQGLVHAHESRSVPALINLGGVCDVPQTFTPAIRRRNQLAQALVDQAQTKRLLALHHADEAEQQRQQVALDEAARTRQRKAARLADLDQQVADKTAQRLLANQRSQEEEEDREQHKRVLQAREQVVADETRARFATLTAAAEVRTSTHTHTHTDTLILNPL